MAVNGDQPDSPICRPIALRMKVSPDEEHTGQSTPKANWERLIGINIFSKIGIHDTCNGVSGSLSSMPLTKGMDKQLNGHGLSSEICAGFALWGIAYPNQR